MQQESCANRSGGHHAGVLLPAELRRVPVPILVPAAAGQNLLEQPLLPLWAAGLPAGTAGCRPLRVGTWGASGTPKAQRAYEDTREHGWFWGSQALELCKAVGAGWVVTWSWGSHGVAEVLGSLVAPGSQWGGPDTKVPMALGTQWVADSYDPHDIMSLWSGTNPGIPYGSGVSRGWYRCWGPLWNWVTCGWHRFWGPLWHGGPLGWHRP